MHEDMRHKLLLVTFLMALLLGISGTALGQSTATLQGTVSDSKGAVIPNATVTVRNQATSIERTAQTDAGGNYQLAALPAGVYTVTVQATGFKRQIVNDLNLEVASTVVKDFQTEVGSIEQTVSISAETAIIESATTSVGTVINQRTVQEIPLNGRHFVDLGLLIPGSVTPPQNGFLTAPLRGQGSFGLNTAGGREDTVNFMINGVNLNDMVQNQITFQPSINTVAEFKADNSTFSAEYGRNSGAIVNIATRSGGNNFHGEVFEFVRNSAFDARNFFERTRDPAPFKRNQFGASVGGPIIKNRTFFFASYEGLRQRQGLTISGVTVPTEVQRAGATDPVLLKLLPLIPHANVGTSSFSGSATAPVDINQWTGDVSHNFNGNDRLHGYYAFQKDRRGEPALQGNNLPGFGDTRASHRQIFTLNETHIFSPTLVNEARFGFNRINILFTPNAQLNPADFGIVLGVPGGPTESIGLPQIAVGGGGVNFGGPANFPQGRADTTYVLADTLNYTRGNHSFKFGAEGRRFYNNNTNKDTGTFGFANTAAFLGNPNAAGVPTTAPVANTFTWIKGQVAPAITQGALGLFIQDNYKLRPNLTLELGLRWDWLMSPTERFDRLVTYVPATNSLVRENNGVAPIYHTNWKNFQPRVGFSWDPFKNGKTSIRGAYAILSDQPVTNLVTGNATNPPFANTITIPGGTTTGFGTAKPLPGSTVSPSSSDPFFNNANVQSWNLNVQREVRQGLAVTIGYFGSKGTHLRLTRNANQGFQLPNGLLSRTLLTLSGSSPIAPNAALANVTFREGTSNSSYNALWATATKRFAKGLQFNASYTWSKSIDYNSQSSQGVTVQDSNNLRGDRGLSDFDARHRFVISGLYELPFHKNRLVDGWQFSAVTQAQSGNPVTILAGAPVNTGLTGVATIRPDAGAPITFSRTPLTTGIGFQYFPNLVCDPRAASTCPAGSVVILPVATVGSAAIFHFGNLGRNVVIGPTFNNTDFSVIKRVKLTESRLIELRWEIFDLFNHANFGQPGRTAQLGSTAFGTITNTRFATGDSGSSRQMQFALKFKF